MKAKTRLKLSIIMISFILMTTFTISIINHMQQKKLVISNYHTNLEQVEEMIAFTLEMLDKAYYFLDDDLDKEMEEHSNYLLQLYEENHNFEEWDFDQLKKFIGMDIYIIDIQNKIIYSSLKEEVGLDFSACCTQFASLLNERRLAGGFYSDSVDVQQQTGDVMKYSYIVTPDHKYIIELGYSLENDSIYQQFSLDKMIAELTNQHDMILDINLLNTDGYLIGETMSEPFWNVERKEAFQQALLSEETKEVESNDNLYRYVFYQADEDQGISTNRVIEVVYNDDLLQQELKDKTKIFILQLFLIFFVTVIISYIIHRWVRKQVYYAYHDSLTGLKNRANFEEELHRIIATEKEKLTSLLVLDLDNFKLVNDTYGHLQGDKLLQSVGQNIDKAIKEEHSTFRLGGDEFAIILPNTTREETETVAKNVLQKLSDSFHEDTLLKEIHITASMGIAIVPDDGTDVKKLFQKADLALYKSKEKGKNQYCFYSNH